MDLRIGLTGLRLAQQAIELVGTNIANASTDGYHRQELLVRPVESERYLGVPIGGAEVAQYQRAVDTLLEAEIRRQQPQLGQLDAELSALQSLEGALGTVSSNPLGQALGNFFSALEQLASQPDMQAFREQALWAAQDLAGQFNHLDTTLADLQHSVAAQARETVGQLNGLADEVAELNAQIASLTLSGGNTNLLADRRDQALLEMSKLIDIQVVQRQDANGMVDVLAAGTSVVAGQRAGHLEIVSAGADLGIRREGALTYDTQVGGGQLAGLLAVHNDILTGVRADLDTLAAQVIQQINHAHVQGVGTGGAFSELTGTPVSDPDATLAAWETPVTAGDIHLQLVGPDGESVRYSLAIDPESDTLATVADALAALDPAHLSTSVVNGRLHVQGLGGWRLDFLGGTDLEANGAWTGTSGPAAGGTYVGTDDETYTFTVLGDGQVGVTDGLAVEVRNSAGQLVTTLEVGQGYSAGEMLDICRGAQVAFGVGTLAAGEKFDLRAVGDSDTSGFWAAAGMNTLFSGESAGTMAVRQELLGDQRLLATAAQQAGTDNLIAKRMAAVRDTPAAGLDDSTPGEFYQLLVTGTGQQISSRTARQEAFQNVVNQLENQRSDASGVDINDEAAKLIVFEQMFQAMAKFLGTQKQAMDALFDLL